MVILVIKFRLSIVMVGLIGVFVKIIFELVFIVLWSLVLLVILMKVILILKCGNMWVKNVKV